MYSSSSSSSEPLFLFFLFHLLDLDDLRVDTTADVDDDANADVDDDATADVDDDATADVDDDATADVDDDLDDTFFAVRFAKGLVFNSNEVSLSSSSPPLGASSTSTISILLSSISSFLIRNFEQRLSDKELIIE